jgi:hypothetical protein
MIKIFIKRPNMSKKKILQKVKGMVFLFVVVSLSMATTGNKDEMSPANQQSENPPMNLPAFPGAEGFGAFT